jgi:hypothetical protein
MKSVTCSKFNYPGKSKGEVVPVHAMKAYGGEEVQSHAVTSVPDVRVSPASKPQPLYLEKEPHYLLNTNLEGPRGESLEILEHRQFSCPHWESNHNSLVI